MNFEEKVMTYMKQKHIIKQKQKIVLGLSGGADSVCLFHILLKCRQKYGIECYAIHVNHGIRGEQAMEDQKFVEELCQRHLVPLKIVTANIQAIAKEKKKSLEEAGREVRYREFHQHLEEIGADYIAIAHHKNDQAETVLHNLCRGSGLVGIAGMRFKKEKLIRPLLCVKREEIEKYLTTIGQSFQIDSTNSDNTYTRNRLRNEMIPQMEKNLNIKTVSHIAATAEILAEIADYLEMTGKIIFQNMVETKEKRMILNKVEWEKEHIVMQKWVLQKMLFQMAGMQKDIGQIHILDLMELMKKQVGKSIDMPYGIKAERIYEGILLEKQEKKEEEKQIKQIEKKETKSNHINEKNYQKENGEYFHDLIEKEILTRNKEVASKTLEAIVFCENQRKRMNLDISSCKSEEDREPSEVKKERKNRIEICVREKELKKNSLEKTVKNNCTKCFDYDKIEGTVLFRRAKQSDFLQINKDGKHKKVKKMLKDEKVAAREREEIFVFADGDHVIWVPGIRISEAYRVCEDTRTILEISICEEQL